MGTAGPAADNACQFADNACQFGDDHSRICSTMDNADEPVSPRGSR